MRRMEWEYLPTYISLCSCWRYFHLSCRPFGFYGPFTILAYPSPWYLCHQNFDLKVSWVMVIRFLVECFPVSGNSPESSFFHPKCPWKLKVFFFAPKYGRYKSITPKNEGKMGSHGLYLVIVRFYDPPVEGHGKITIPQNTRSPAQQHLRTAKSCPSNRFWRMSLFQYFLLWPDLNILWN